MEIVYSSVDLGASFVELYTAYLVFANVFEGNKKRKSIYKDIIMAIVGVLVVLFCNKFKLFSYVTIIIVWIYLSMSARMEYKYESAVIFSISGFYLLCMNCMDFLVLTIISNLHQGSETFQEIINDRGPFRTIATVIIKVIWILIYLYIRKYLCEVYVNVKNSVLILLISLIGFSGFVFVSNETIKTVDYMTSVLWLIFMCLLLAAMLIIYFSSLQKQEKMKIGYLESRNQLLIEKYDSMNEMYCDNAKLYHDISNHMNILYHFLDIGNIEGAKKYIKEISKPILKLSKINWTGVDVIDIVINSKLHEMNKLGINWDVNVEFPYNSNLLPSDLCTILSNILDNAIEAAKTQTDNKDITLTIRRINYFLFIRVVNPCGYLKDFDFIPTSTKENQRFHGWGLQSVSDIVKKNNGTLECINRNHMFTVSIMLAFDEKNVD
ncbi:MAG: GHKL domain-containing protein [Dorea sp.]|nr:GHKL domain-containing protein [Dorea sp.]